MKTILSRPVRSSLLAGLALAAVLTAGAGLGSIKPAAADTFKADLRVKAVSSQQIGGSVMYTFNVKNNGISDAAAAAATGWCWYEHGGYTGALPASFPSNGHLPMGTIKSGETRTLMVFCAPYFGEVATGFRVTVTAANELDPSDNTASIGVVH